MRGNQKWGVVVCEQRDEECDMKLKEYQEMKDSTDEGGSKSRSLVNRRELQKTKQNTLA